MVQSVRKVQDLDENGSASLARWRFHAVAVCLILACYACGRVLQVVHGPPATTPLVAMEVFSAFALAVVDGARRWGIRGVAVFVAICTVVGNIVENVGVATGFPYGHYHFLDVMGPKLFVVPVLLGLAYIGMAYASWTLGAVLVGRGAPARMLAVPCVAAVFMTAWDVAQDPVWSTMLHAWAWHDGGRWFGVPLQNYFGWYLNVVLIFFLFSLYEARAGVQRAASAWPALALYVLCAAGNVLQLLTRAYAPVSVDASGKGWSTEEILAVSAVVSVVLMGGLAAAAAKAGIRGQGSEVRG
jgi:uncharacterized membrane protein